MSRQDNSLGFVEPEYDIGKAFDKIENELIASMIRNMDRHRAEELKEGYDWEMWQALQLKQLEKYKKLNAARFKGRFKDINTRIEDLIRESNKKGYLSEEIKILEAIKQGFFANKSEEALAGAFFRLNERKLNALVRATVKDMGTAETAILRMANDRYRKAIFNAQVYANTGAGTYEQAVDMATKDMLSSGLNCVQYKNGARHTLANYARMAIRTANKRAYLQGEGAKRQEWGISTVIVNKRSGACPLCMPFVGKVMIDDVWSGGKPADGPYMLLSSAMEAGFYHPNCKDSHSTYFPMLDDNPEARFSRRELKEIEEDYRQEQLINYADRQVRKYTRLAENSLDEGNVYKYERKLNEWYQVVVNRIKNGIIDDTEGSFLPMDLQLFAEKDLKNQSSNSLRRSIRNFEKRIAEHEHYIENPISHCPDWETKDPRRQQGLIKHWQKEISNFKESIQNRIDELKERGEVL